MELEWVRTFLAVVDSGGFALASEQIHRSQSRVSAHIAALERDLGVTLLDRAQRPVALTHAGDLFANYARDILSRVGAARAALGALHALVEGDIALLTTPCAGAAYVPAMLRDFLRSYPHVRVELIERTWEEIDPELLSRRVVLAVRPVRPPLVDPELRRRVLWRERMKLVVPPDHPLAGSPRPAPVDAFAREPLIVMGRSVDSATEASLLLARHGSWPRIAFAVDSPQTLVAMARAGLGVGLVNTLALQICSTEGAVVLDVEGRNMVRDVAAYWYDVLLDTEVGRALHDAVLATPLPAGTRPVEPAVSDPAAGTLEQIGWADTVEPTGGDDLR